MLYPERFVMDQITVPASHQPSGRSLHGAAPYLQPTSRVGSASQLLLRELQELSGRQGYSPCVQRKDGPSPWSSRARSNPAPPHGSCRALGMPLTSPHFRFFTELLYYTNQAKGLDDHLPHRTDQLCNCYHYNHCGLFEERQFNRARCNLG